MSIAAERAWLMIAIQLGKLANDIGAAKKPAAGKTLDRVKR